MKFQYRYLLFLSSSLFRFGLAFFTLPITTRILDADDYGMHALVVSVTLLVMTFANVGSHYVLSYRFPDASRDERREIVSTIVWIGLGLFAVGGLLLMTVWSAVAPRFTATAAVPTRFVWLGLLTTWLMVPWQAAVPVLTLDRRAGTYAAILVGETLVGVTATITLLYAFRLDVGALFWGGLWAATFNLVVTLTALRRYLAPRVSRAYVREILTFVGPGMASDFAWRGGDMIRNLMINAFVGLGQLGLYSHAYKYRQMVFMYAKAASSSIEPTTLTEAKAPPYAFEKTDLVWNTIFVSLVLIGVFFAYLGADAIALLTNGKFTAAAAYVPFLVIVVLLQFTARTDNAVVLVNDAGRFALWGQTVGYVVGTAVLALTIPLIGVWGAVLGEIVLMLTHRGFVIYKARQHAPGLGFHDKWVVYGVAIISVSWAVNWASGAPLGTRLLLAAMTGALTLLLAFPDLRRVYTLVRERGLLRVGGG